LDIGICLEFGIWKLGFKRKKVMKVLKIGIVGCGSIGSRLAKAVVNDLPGKAKLVALYDLAPKKADDLAKVLRAKVETKSLATLIKKSDLVIEAASAKISAQLCRKVILAGKDMMVMSSGGILSDLKVLDLAQKKNCKIYFPSGAIAGLDAVKAARQAKIESIQLTTYKPPKALSGAPYVEEKGINLDEIKNDTVIFAGSVQEAVLGFPQNINVCATLSLASLAMDKTRVKIIAVVGAKVNKHELEVKGDFGRIFCVTENVPSPENPKTSYLAVLSAIATLKQILEPVKVGT
jgi:aspartate dehydrogenase